MTLANECEVATLPRSRTNTVASGKSSLRELVVIVVAVKRANS